MENAATTKGVTEINPNAVVYMALRGERSANFVQLLDQVTKILR